MRNKFVLRKEDKRTLSSDRQAELIVAIEPICSSTIFVLFNQPSFTHLLNWIFVFSPFWQYSNVYCIAFALITNRELSLRGLSSKAASNRSHKTICAHLINIFALGLFIPKIGPVCDLFHFVEFGISSMRGQSL